ncbi:unnamed protein product [Pleuronectes platessa]|uniref:Uncharacterized protein n=1 Tax=Pleuronectes platessa TaxID=8262 RepID=A0A9N7U367_PLEPL|nr:unnamed protein product [Pleuronectes platessa]
MKVVISWSISRAGPARNQEAESRPPRSFVSFSSCRWLLNLRSNQLTALSHPVYYPGPGGAVGVKSTRGDRECLKMTALTTEAPSEAQICQVSPADDKITC